MGRRVRTKLSLIAPVDHLGFSQLKSADTCQLTFPGNRSQRMPCSAEQPHLIYLYSTVQL